MAAAVVTDYSVFAAIEFHGQDTDKGLIIGSLPIRISHHRRSINREKTAACVVCFQHLGGPQSLEKVGVVPHGRESRDDFYRKAAENSFRQPARFYPEFEIGLVDHKWAVLRPQDV